MEGQLTKLMLRIESQVGAAAERDEERAAEREAMEVMTEVLARNIQTPRKPGPMAGPDLTDPTALATALATDLTDPTDSKATAMKTPGGLMHSAGGSVI